MENLARRRADNTVHQELGAVLRVDGLDVTVSTPDGEYVARRAVSCLVAPRAGDEVILAFGGDRGRWVLAVLEREAVTPTRVSVEGDLEVSLPSGRFVVAADEGVELVSGRRVTVTAGELRVDAGEATLSSQALALLGRVAQVEVERIRTVAESIDRVAGRAWERVRRSYRFVEETDHLRAERIDYEATGAVNLHGENAVVTAEALVKVDGAQIHLG